MKAFRIAPLSAKASIWSSLRRAPLLLSLMLMADLPQFAAVAQAKSGCNKTFRAPSVDEMVEEMTARIGVTDRQWVGQPRPEWKLGSKPSLRREFDDAMIAEGFKSWGVRLVFAADLVEARAMLKQENVSRESAGEHNPIYRGELALIRPLVVVVPGLRAELGEVETVDPSRRVISEDKMKEFLLKPGVRIYEALTEEVLVSEVTQESYPRPTGNFRLIPYRQFLSSMGIRPNRADLDYVFSTRDKSATAKFVSDKDWTSQIVFLGWTRQKYFGIITARSARAVLPTDGPALRERVVWGYLALTGRLSITKNAQGIYEVSKELVSDNSTTPRPRILLLNKANSHGNQVLEKVVEDSFYRIGHQNRKNLAKDTDNRFQYKTAPWQDLVDRFNEGGSRYILAIVDAENQVIGGIYGEYENGLFEGETVFYLTPQNVNGADEHFTGNSGFAKITVASLLMFLSGQGTQFAAGPDISGGATLNSGMVTDFTAQTGGGHRTRRVADGIFEPLKTATPVEFPRDGVLGPQHLLGFLFPDLRSMSPADRATEIKIWLEGRDKLRMLFDAAVQDAHLYAEVDAWLHQAIQECNQHTPYLNRAQEVMSAIRARLELRRRLAQMGTDGALTDKNVLTLQAIAHLVRTKESADAAIKLFRENGIEVTAKTLESERAKYVNLRYTEFARRFAECKSLEEMMHMIASELRSPEASFEYDANLFWNWLATSHKTTSFIELLGILGISPVPQNHSALHTAIRGRLLSLNQVATPRLHAEELNRLVDQITDTLREIKQPYEGDVAFAEQQKAARQALKAGKAKTPEARSTKASEINPPPADAEENVLDNHFTKQLINAPWVVEYVAKKEVAAWIELGRVLNPEPILTYDEKLAALERSDFGRATRDEIKNTLLSKGYVLAHAEVYAIKLMIAKATQAYKKSQRP